METDILGTVGRASGFGTGSGFSPSFFSFEISGKSVSLEPSFPMFFHVSNRKAEPGP